MEKNVHQTLRRAQVSDDEEQAQDNHGNGVEFTKNENLAEFLIVMQVFGNNQHYGRGRDTNQEGELRDIESPADVTAHAGDDQAVGKLLPVAGRPNAHQQEQKGDPTPINFCSSYGFFKHDSPLRRDSKHKVWFQGTDCA